MPSKTSPEQQLKKKASRGKYGAKKVLYQGMIFDSTLECNCYKALQKMQAKGLLSEIACQVPIALLSSTGVRVGNAVIDFRVTLTSGVHCLVEAKGVETALWRWKKKHVVADSGLPLVMITSRNLYDIEKVVMSLGRSETKVKRKKAVTKGK